MKLIIKIIKYIFYVIYINYIVSKLFGFKWGKKKAKELDGKIDILEKEIKDLLPKKIYFIILEIAIFFIIGFLYIFLYS